MKKMFFIVVVCLFSGMFYSFTPEELEDAIAIDNPLYLTGEEDGQTPAGEGE